MVYYKTKNKLKNYKNTKKSNPSELLNSKQTKKALILNNIISKHTGGKKNKINNILLASINNSNSNYSNLYLNKDIKLSNKHYGGNFNQTKALEHIIIKTYKIYNKLAFKYIPKATLLYDKINDVNKSNGIAKIHRMIKHILDLEKKLNFIHVEKKKSSSFTTQQTFIDDIKLISKWYTKWFGLKAAVSFHISNISKSIRELQDHIREKLMKEISFNNVDDLIACRNWKLQKNMKDSFICDISLYRKIESKINKYFKKFQVVYINFIETMDLSCDELSTYKNKINEEEFTYKTSKVFKVPDIFDFTICEGYDNIHKNIEETFDNLIKSSQTNLENIAKTTNINKYNKTRSKYIKSSKTELLKIEKIKTKVKNYKEISKTVKDGFTSIFNKFSTIEIDLNKMFANFESIGLHRYISNFSEYKKKFYLSSGQKILKKQIKALSINQSFINMFTKMLTIHKTDADSYYNKLFNPKDEDFRYEIIPNLIQIRNDVEIKYLNINMDIVTNDYLLIVNDSTIITRNISERIDILFIQNIPSEKMKNIIIIRDSTGGQADINLQLIVYSGCGKETESDGTSYKFTTYNAIYYNTNSFADNTESGTIDQSKYFRLKDIPDNMSTADIRSFASINIIDYHSNREAITDFNRKTQNTQQEVVAFFTTFDYVKFANKVFENIKNENINTIDNFTTMFTRELGVLDTDIGTIKSKINIVFKDKELALFLKIAEFCRYASLLEISKKVSDELQTLVGTTAPIKAQFTTYNDVLKVLVESELDNMYNNIFTDTGVNNINSF